MMKRFGVTLVLAGTACLSWAGWQSFGSDAGAQETHRALVAQVEHPAKARTANALPAIGDAFAVVRIPRFGADYAVPVVEGTEAPQLAKGIGHAGGTAMPGERGNFGTAGHRVTMGRPYWAIDTLAPGDLINVTYRGSVYSYAVTRHLVVSPDRGDLLTRGHGPGTMTLVACHPKFSAAQRYIVQAKLVPRNP